MKCDICNKDYSFLNFIGRDNVCNNCIAKHTVFKEVKHSEETLLRKAMRAYDIKNFDELKNIKEWQKEELAEGNVRNKRKKTFKYKKNRASAVRVGGGDSLDYQDELDTTYDESDSMD